MATSSIIRIKSTVCDVRKKSAISFVVANVFANLLAKRIKHMHQWPNLTEFLLSKDLLPDKLRHIILIVHL